MEKLEIDCLVAGKPSLLSGKRFETPSSFYEDYSFLAADCGLFDVKRAVSKATHAIRECQSLSFETREEILCAASKKFDWQNKKFSEYVVKMTGMPIHFVTQHLKEASETLNAVPSLVRQRLGISNGRLHQRPVQGMDFYTIFHPLSGVIYAVTPGNDPRAVPFVAAWCATLGIPCVIKPSKNDLLVSRAIVKTIIDCGYPAAGLNLVSWDTTKEDSQAKNFALVDSAKAVWAFGEDATVDGLLRFHKNDDKLDHFSGKTILRHAAGRSAAVCDQHADLDKTAKIIVESSFNWPISCNATKAVFDASGKHEELVAKIKQITEKEFTKFIGDPMKESTRVGFVEAKLLAHAVKRVNELKKFSLIKELVQLKQISSHQIAPILLETHDNRSEFLSKEHSLYVLCLKSSKTFQEAVDEANGSSEENKRISVSVFCDDENKVLNTYLHAHHVKRSRHSTELDVLYHEGNDYLNKLTLPQVHRVVKNKTNN